MQGCVLMKRAQSTRLVPAALLSLLIISVVGATGLPLLERALRSVATVSDIQKGTGNTFIGRLSDSTLSDHEKPTEAQLYLVEEQRGTRLRVLLYRCASSYVCAWLSALLDNNYPYATHEETTAIGPGGSPHQEISEHGGGRYSVWKGYVYFSLPNAQQAVAMKRVYLETPSVLKRRVLAVATVCGWVRDLLLLVILLRWLWQKPFDWIGANVAPGLAISVAALCLAGAGAEFFFRESQRFPVTEIQWPRRFVPNVGHTMEPNADTKWTNGTDYWVVDKTNSLGFPDREPALPKPEGTFRVMMVGDSFVEAAQVPLAQKTQTLLAADLKRKFPDLATDVVALGFAGTGQSNQLAYYERNRAAFRPDLVILLFVGNDFANNSALLESLRNGFHPDHVPRLYFNAGESCERIKIDNEWQSHLLAASSPQARAQLLSDASPVWKRALAGLDLPREDELDLLFYRDKMPPAFVDALASTRCAFAEWKRIAEEDHFKLLVAAVEGVRANGEGQLVKLRAILEPLGIPLLDLYPAFLAKGELAAAHWKSDSHWAPTGHRWAAEAISDYLSQNKMISRR